jgi:Peptidase family M1 domain
LNRLAPRTLALALVPILLFLCAFSCDAPLVPGYQILRESREVRFVPGGSTALHIQGSFKLENTGNGDLTFLDVTLPEEKAFGRQNLRVELNGREIGPVPIPAEYRQDQPDAVRIPLDPPWPHEKTLELAIEYDLISPEDPGSRITLGEDEFHLGSRGWFPVLEPPRRVLSPFPRRPKATWYRVRVPSNFLVLARGTPKGKKRQGGETEYRFLLSEDDLPPYVVAGSYVQSSPQLQPDSARFWTRKPLPSNPEQAARQITETWDVLENDFGPLDRNIAAPHVVESPQLREDTGAEETGPAATSFPGGVLVNPAALALGTDSEPFLEMVTHALAHNWFGNEMYPAPDAALGLGEGLPEYATVVVDQARHGPSARRQRIAEYLKEYDEARKSAAEKPLGITMLSDTPAQRQIALAKAPLFFVALEDACGADAMRQGLRHMVEVLRGQEASYDSLRSALEEASGKNLGELFRVWLNQDGIPADFRSRYEQGRN